MEWNDQTVKIMVSHNLGHCWHGDIIYMIVKHNSKESSYEYENNRKYLELSSKEKIASKDGHTSSCLVYQTQ